MQNVSNKQKVLNLLIFLVVLSTITFLHRFTSFIPIYTLRLSANWLLNIFLGFVAYIFIKKANMKLDLGFKSKKAYFIGIILAVVLQIIFGIIPAVLGQSIVGGHTDFILWSFVYQFFYFVLIIGPTEELIFRVYIQDTIIELLPKNKWIGVVIASLLFGFWHLINGNMVQVIFTTILGLAFGFAKYSIKECRYTGVAVAHGLYDFLNVVTTTFIV